MKKQREPDYLRISLEGFFRAFGVPSWVGSRVLEWWLVWPGHGEGMETLLRLAQEDCPAVPSVSI